jgi:hypothetical protein
MTLMICISCVAGAVLLTLLRVGVRIAGSLLWGCITVVKWSAIATAASLAL